MATARNSVTGDLLTSRSSTDLYRDGWDSIFGKKADVAQAIPVPEADNVEQADMIPVDPAEQILVPLPSLGKASKMRQHFQCNNYGRDFVCGDLHGAYDRLVEFMEFVKFDKCKDRMFSVGDLVDRGPKNVECLELIYEPWFFPVKANHEQMMSEYFQRQPYGDYWIGNGGSWGLEFKCEMSERAMLVRDAAAIAGNLPLMITVDKKDGTKFHMIHAELHARGPITDSDLADTDKFAKAALTQSFDGDFILWGRSIFQQLYARQMNKHTIGKFKRSAQMHKYDAMFNPALSHIYSGHTVVQQPTRFCGQTNIDTKAYGSCEADPKPWCGLTVTEPETDRFWTVFKNGIDEVTPLDLSI